MPLPTHAAARPKHPMKNKPVVNSCTEWERLEEVIVARLPDDACFQPEGPDYRGKGNNEYIRSTQLWPRGPKHPSAIQTANHLYDSLAELLRDEGVVVKRPAVVPQDCPITTPHWSVPTGYNCCPRDKLLVVGNELVEAPMSQRSRLFEEYCYRDLILDYYDSDPHMLWTVAPKPMMRDSLYTHPVDVKNGVKPAFWDRLDARFARKTGYINPDDVRSGRHVYEFSTTEDEPVFDAADVARFGKDLFVIRSNTTNRLGFHWLRRHFARRDIGCHLMHFPDDLHPQHIDGGFVPLRPGFVLVNRERPALEWETEKFREGGWKLVASAKPNAVNYPMPDFCESSANGMSVNTLSVSPEKVVVEAHETELIAQLDDFGFDVIPLPFREAYQFGGGLHCATVDIRRAGEMKDYFSVTYN